MPSRRISQVVERLRMAALVHDADRLSDGQLLERFLDRHDDAACAALVRRHAQMVWGVCRRLLNHHEAEDAFQATFLVLLRRGRSVRPREMVANWLHGVARQTALKARALMLKRRIREKQVIDMPHPEAAPADQWSDLKPIIDEELSRLSASHRAIIILCDLEGRPRREVARQLGCPEGTVASRLARARALLAKRLSSRGVTVSAVALATALAEETAAAWAPPATVSATIKAVTLVAAGQAAATGFLSANVLALMKGVLQGMLLNKLKVTLSAFVLVAAAGFGAGGILYATQEQDGLDKVAGAKAAQDPARNQKNAQSPASTPLKIPKDFVPPPGRDEQAKGALAAQDPLIPPPPTPPLSPADQLRQRYLALQEELSRHLSPDQMASRVGVLEKEVAEVRERKARLLKEQKAANELQRIAILLEKLAVSYPDTDAGRKAQRALDQAITRVVAPPDFNPAASSRAGSSRSEKK